MPEYGVELPRGADTDDDKVEWILDTSAGVLIGMIRKQTSMLLVPPKRIGDMDMPPLTNWRSTVAHFRYGHPDSLIEDDWVRCGVKYVTPYVGEVRFWLRETSPEGRDDVLDVGEPIWVEGIEAKRINGIDFDELVGGPSDYVDGWTNNLN